MMDIQALKATVQDNCHISDAVYAGNYTLCVFLLKMREYYRWEKGLPLTARLGRQEVRDWLVERETKWEEIEENPLTSLELGGDPVDPYDTDSVNEALVPEGFVYSAGMGVFKKPHFYVGVLERHEQIEGVDIYVSGREIARDLVAPPSMYRDRKVFIREESLRRHLWEGIEEWRFRKSDPHKPMGRAVAAYDERLVESASDEATEGLLDRMSANEIESLLRHELGEAQAGKLLGAGWEVMLATHSRSKLEFYARGGRDVLADCLVTLPQMLADDNVPSLHLYFANFKGVRKALFPALQEAYVRWTAGDGLGALHEIVRRGAEHWTEHLRAALAQFDADPEDAESVVARIEAGTL